MTSSANRSGSLKSDSKLRFSYKHRKVTDLIVKAYREILPDLRKRGENNQGRPSSSPEEKEVCCKVFLLSLQQPSGLTPSEKVTSTAFSGIGKTSVAVSESVCSPGKNSVARVLKGVKGCYIHLGALVIRVDNHV